ncbi:MAG: DNA alkylation repair protein [Planctomycetota bacterium]
MSLRPEDIPASTVRAIERGERETANLAELLAVDLRKIAKVVLPKASASELKPLAPGEAITKRQRAGGALVLEHFGDKAPEKLAGHASDIVRAWGVHSLGHIGPMTVLQRLQRAKVFADDPHFGVREEAWLSQRAHIIEGLPEFIERLELWTRSKSANLRRYATEATRPRGVWCKHIRVLREDPALGFSLLEPLKSDSSKYVQDSVANWLNDAAKDQPAWVIEVTDRWLKESDTDATKRIVKRARRSIR